VQNFQNFVFRLIDYWGQFGCLWSQPYDAAMGAGTFHPHTFLKGLGPEPWRSVYVQPCRRPVDGRYGESPYRFQHYYQLQVFLKPAPADIVDVFLRSLEHIGIRLQDNDISLLEDDWKGPTLGAWGLGWEVRANGQEVTQFTYFQQLGGLDLDVVSGEITYGLERLYMYATGLKSALEIPYNNHFSYGDIFKQNEFEFSHFNFKTADVDQLFSLFAVCEEKVKELCGLNLVLPAYDFVLQASHAFNLLDARGAISVSERQRYIGRVRECARLCAAAYCAERAKIGFPMMTRLPSDPRLPFFGGPTSDVPQDQKSIHLSSQANHTKAAHTDSIQSIHSDNANTVSLCVELGVEEMPPSFQTAASEQLEAALKAWKTNINERFALVPEFVKQMSQIDSKILISARRLVLLCDHLPAVEPTVTREFWGPAQRIARAADGSLTPAALGFAKKQGLEVSALQWKEKPDGIFLYGAKEELGGSLPDLLAREFVLWCQKIESGLKMKWIVEEGATPFVRPVRWICALANDRIIKLEAFGLTASNKTFGQRILHPYPVTVSHARDYLKALAPLDVMPSRQQRIEFIQGQASRIAESVGGTMSSDIDGLIEKVAGLSECPQVFLGHIPEKFMRLPERLITSVLREHMNYLSVAHPQTGQAMPYYIGIAGYPCAKMESMIEATATVVSGRLDDGAFYFDGDLKTPLHHFFERLDSQLFQAGMGTLKDKSMRVSELAKYFAKATVDARHSSRVLKDQTNASDSQGNSTNDLIEAAEVAGLYCKADLKSGCVQEFPDEMQGLMGGFLVREQKLFGANCERVAAAIAEHYAPVGASADLPKTELGKILSLADRLDSLTVLIGHGTDVKGNKDPFALRRTALAILRLLGADGALPAVHLSLSDCIQAALRVSNSTGMTLLGDTEEKIFQFILARLKALWRTQYDPGAVEAICARVRTQTIASSLDWVKATSRALARREGEFDSALALAMVPYKRCRTLTEDLLKSGDWPSVETNHFVEEEERNLFEALERAEADGHDLLQGNECERYLQLLAELRHPMAEFFDKVLVNAPDFKIKQNRLAVLLRVRRLYDTVADFSLVQVAGHG
jgi:glycyl-tRNA synthetase